MIDKTEEQEELYKKVIMGKGLKDRMIEGLNASYFQMCQAFRNFIWTWGTHYTSEVTMGGEMYSKEYFSKDSQLSKDEQKSETKLDTNKVMQESVGSALAYLSSLGGSESEKKLQADGTMVEPVVNSVYDFIVS